MMGDSTSEMESGEEKVVGGGELAPHLMRSGFTNMVATIINRMQAEAIASLLPNVRALHTLQKDIVEVESQFCSEVHQLECKYEKLYKPLFEKIVNGTYKPTDAECQNPRRDETEEEELARAVQQASLTDKKEGEEKPAEPPMDPNVKGVPDFWYTIFRNVSMLSKIIENYDEPILKTLQDIKVLMHEDPISFTLEFHFSPNDYFTNTVLTKEYLMNCKPDDVNPTLQIYVKGCEINWKKGKDVTKSMQTKSFFYFFSPPAMPEDPNSTLASDIDDRKHLTADFEIGQYIRERVVPRAVLLYAGVGLDDEDDGDYEEEVRTATATTSTTTTTTVPYPSPQSLHQETANGLKFWLVVPGRLKIRVIPTIALVKRNKTKDFIVGFTDLGNRDDFSTETLEWRIARSDLIEYAGDMTVPPEEARAQRKLHIQSKKTVRG